VAENQIIRQALDRFSDDLEAPSEGTFLDLIGEKVLKRQSQGLINKEPRFRYDVLQKFTA